MTPETILLPLLAWLFGSVPFGRIMMVLFANTQMDSPGTANVPPFVIWQTGRHRLALATAILEMAKCSLSVVLALSLSENPFLPTLAFVAGIAGHFFPPLGRFKTTLTFSPVFGGLLALNPSSAILCGILWLALTLTSRRPPLASIGTVCVLPMMLFLHGAPAYELFASLFVAGIVLFVYRRHIVRLMRKKEPAWF
ncbi:MAG: hypothetical protein GC134_05435 [Proteobacteria bacterium]|nr:hypothetical protein [Pseudomonadota bacterium]